MLSRVAENIYWMARYVERAENIARLINVTTNLILDLPKSANVGWEHIIEIMGSEMKFHELYDEVNERNILRFMIADTDNSGSLLGSLQMARENARTIRDIIPRESWESINDLYQTSRSTVQSGIARKNRHAYLQKVILGAQTLTGQLAGTMYHDIGYDFLRMGRNLERGDMTTRIIDVRSEDLLEEEHAGPSAYENIQWMSVLKSLTGYQMYRRIVQVRVRRPDVLKFLLQERKFPRAVFHTLCEVESCLGNLPRSDSSLNHIAELKRKVMGVNLQKLEQAQLNDFIDQVQVGLIKVHNDITSSYFARD